jgi:hypothetical protein
MNTNPNPSPTMSRWLSTKPATKHFPGTKSSDQTLIVPGLGWIGLCISTRSLRVSAKTAGFATPRRQTQPVLSGTRLCHALLVKRSTHTSTNSLGEKKD